MWTRQRRVDVFLGVNRRDFVALAAVAPFALRARLAAPPHAFVTCDEESRLAVVDLTGFRVVRSIATPAAPRAIERVGARALVAHWTLGSVSIVDARRVLHVVEGIDEPRYAAAHPDGAHAFVSDSGHGVAVVDTLHGRIVGRVRLPDWPRHVSVDAAGRTLWVGLGSASAQVAVVDVSDRRRPRLLGLLRPPFRAHDVGVAPDGRTWITAGEAGDTAIYSAGRALHRTLGADAAPQHVTFGRGVAYVTSGGAGTLRVQSLSDGRVLRSVRIPVGSYNVQYALGRVISPSLSHGTLAILDRHAALLATVPVAGSCHDACFAPA